MSFNSGLASKIESGECLVEITQRLMCDDTRALLLPSFSDCVPVKRPLKALLIFGRLCI